MTDELIVDSFAGGGGASLGIELALGRSPDIAINHDAEAVAMHAANHPGTAHYCRSVWHVDPVDAVGRRPVGLAWFSPDCKHFSKAKGGRPVSRNVRDLAWIVVLWARRVRPRVICLENVEEFRSWGPVGLDGQPCRERAGETFAKWTGELRRLGYRVEHRELRACDYGAPTIRKRLFLIARRDGRPIVWPKPTHGRPDSEDVKAGRLKPWRTAAECIDWSLPCPSIFLTREEGRALGVNRPLAEATMARIARGIRRYVLEAARPFIVPITHAGDVRVHDLAEPLRTITTAHRGEHALVAPFVTKFRQHSTGSGLDEPLHTVTAGGDMARPAGAAHAMGLVSPFLVPRYGERPGQDPRTHDLADPMPTVVPTANGGSLVAAHLQRQFGASTGSPADEPTGTVMPGGGGKTALVAAFLAQHNGGMVGHAATEPVSTLTTKGCHQQVVAAMLSTYYGTGSGSTDRNAGPDEPLRTQTTENRHALVKAFLVKFYGNDQHGQGCDEPLHTVPTRDRFGLVTVDGEDFAIVDIGMRMLVPRELFRAQGFPDSYVIDPVVDGRPLPKTAQVRMCGNSVCPPLAAALVAANCPELARESLAA